MPYCLTCPECSAKLKTASALPIGRQAQCPKCRHTFAVTAENQVELDAKPAPAPRPPAEAARVTKAVPPATAHDDDETPRSRRREDDDADRPRSRRRDDDDDEPRSRKRDEDDDDRPRRRRDEDDDDDRPKRRRSRAEDGEPRSRRRSDDDDDDRPRRQRRDEDEDDDSDRPRRRKKRKKKSSAGPMILLSILALAGIGGLIALLVWLFSDGSYDQEMMAYLPDDSAVIVGVDVEELMKVDVVKEFADKGIPGADKQMDVVKKAGLSINDLSKIIVGMTDPGTGAPSGVAIFRFKNNVDKDKINKAIGATELKSGDKAYYKFAGRSASEGGFLFYPKDDLLVFSDSEERLRKVMGKEEGKITIDADLKEIAGKVGGGNIWMAMSTKSLQSDGAGKGKGANPFAGMMNFTDKGPLKGSKGFGGYANITNSTIKLFVVIKCADSTTASKFADEANAEIKKAKKELSSISRTGMEMDVARDALNSVDVSSSGDLIEGSVKFDYRPLVDLFKGKMKGNGGFGFPFGMDR